MSANTTTSGAIVRELQLEAHPEGGYYRETYRSAETLVNAAGVARNLCTAIYYLLEDDQKSHFHKIKSDELWFFHMGASLEIVSIRDGILYTDLLGIPAGNGEMLQVRIPAHTWFAARVKEGSGFSLVSCTVAPGFDFADFEMADRSSLLNEFPHLSESINLFTKNLL